MGIENVGIFRAVRVSVYWLVTDVHVFYREFRFEDFQSYTVNALCFERSYLPYDVVTVGQHFNHFEGTFPVEGLKLFFTNLWVVFGVKQQNKVVHFERMCFGFSVIVSFVLVLCSYYVVCVVLVDFVHAV